MANAQFWTEKATGFTNPGRTLNSIAIVDADVIWANEFDFDAEDYTLKGFTLSTDKGNTWTSGAIDLGANTDELGISSITAVSATTAWISAYPDTFGTTQIGGIWKTTDTGVTWTKQATAFNGTDSYANFVYFWDANNGIAAGDPESGEFEIYTTTDAGDTWTRVDGTAIPDPDAGGEFGVFNRYSVSGNTIWFGTNLGRIFKSNDKGLHWTAAQSPGTDQYSDFTFSTSLKGLLMKYNASPPYELYSTADGGDTWSLVPATTDFYKTDIRYLPNTSTVIATASRTPYSSRYSTDDGVTWTTIDSGNFHGALTFLNDSFGFSASKNTNATTGGIYKFSGIPLKAPSFDVENQISAYPNPTKGVLHLDSEKFQ